jgi:pimeloyl-ACP methyl ester carboxylesterase
MIASIVMAAAAAAASVPISIAGPQGSINGTFVDAGKGAPVVLIIPGSGPTDRDGNNPLGVTAAPYRLLADALATRGVSTLRADKRGLFGSKSAIADPNKVTIADYAADAHNWATALRQRTGVKCVWLLGHSEGALIALAAGQNPAGLCGIITVEGPGRKIADVLREQLKDNPANAPLLGQALAGIASLEAGKPVDPSTMPAPLQRLFTPAVQPFLMNMMRYDPANLASHVTQPMMIVQGGRDIQVGMADAEALHAGQPKARLTVLPEMNHVLKDVKTDDRAANMAAYGDPSLPVDPGLVDAIVGFVKP